MMRSNLKLISSVAIQVRQFSLTSEENFVFSNVQHVSTFLVI